MQFGMKALSVFLLATAAASAAQAAGDAKKGAQLVVVCQACHSFDKGGDDGIGPNLFGVVGRKPASRPSYSYSAALKAVGFKWTNDKLKAWVMGPARLVPGTKMTFAGFPDAKADDVVAYLDTLK
jgi:cytochrome c